MTTITIYPLFSNYVNIDALALYAKNSGLTVTQKSSQTTDSNFLICSTITVSQILSAGQQTTIQNIFQGTAYITFT